MSFLSGALSVVCLATGLLHLVRLVALRDDVPGEASHATMGLGMAAMFAPLGDPVPAPLWIVAFALGLVWFGAQALRTGGLGGELGHHVVGSATMLFMLLGGHADAPAGAAEPGGHLAHGGGPDGDLGLTSVAAIVLAGYFAWHALRCSDRWRSARALAGPTDGPAPGAPASDGAASDAASDGPAPDAWAPGASGTLVARRPVLLAPRTAAAAHLAMAAAMTVMLLGMV